jgi:hypothetical protein
MAMSFTPLTAQEVFTKNLSDQIIKSLSESGIITQSKNSESTGDPCQNTIYKWKRKGIIPFHKRSKHLYFLRSEIDSWLKSKRGFTKHEMETIVNAEIRKGGVR